MGARPEQEEGRNGLGNHKGEASPGRKAISSPRFAAFYNWLMGRPLVRRMFDPLRREVVGQAHGVVLEVGAGGGQNFPWLQEAVGPHGKIIGVDLTDAMLEQARLRVTQAGWKNVELVQADAASYVFPPQVNGILSTFALTFLPEVQRVIQSGCQALVPGARWVVLDMAWPHALPWWFSHLLFFLRLSRYGITAEVVRRRPWQTVWSTMQQSLVAVERQPFWMGFFYLAWGEQPESLT